MEQEQHRDVFVYEIGEKLYVNLTNRCTNRCTFCVRNHRDDMEGYNLWLDHEPTAEQVIEAMGDLSKYKEVVFVGFGEPTMRLQTLIQVAEEIKRQGKPVRLDTNGHANAIHKRNIVPELRGLVDTVSISLNATDAQKYDAICLPCIENAYQAMLDFTKCCVGAIPKVILSVVDVIGDEEIRKAQEIAGTLGATLRVRAYIP